MNVVDSQDSRGRLYCLLRSIPGLRLPMLVSKPQRHCSYICFTLGTRTSPYSTIESFPLSISYFSPTSCVFFVIHGDFRKISRSSLTLSSILQYLVSKSPSRLRTPQFHLRACDLAKLSRFNGCVICWCDFAQCMLDLCIVKVGQSAICHW